MKETAAIINAITGNTGYKGTLKGRIIPGSFFLNCKRETMDIIYKVKAPKTEIVMISEVLPVSNAIVPIPKLTSKALAGV